jgi:hypothetical protein
MFFHILVLFVLSTKSEVSNCSTKDNCNDGLICLNETCQFCSFSYECKENYYDNWDCYNGICNHKDLWPLDWRDILSFILNFFFAALSAASGMTIIYYINYT